MSNTRLAVRESPYWRSGESETELLTYALCGCPAEGFIDCMHAWRCHLMLCGDVYRREPRKHQRNT